MRTVLRNLQNKNYKVPQAASSGKLALIATFCSCDLETQRAGGVTHQSAMWLIVCYLK